ncbi:hypothetical protein [Streptomyces lavendulocolor]|uniref:hypothetical protein n=1 Tax=Streptomyces lavendulocolor TaxID=67316 RepID=UPI003410F4C1
METLTGGTALALAGVVLGTLGTLVGQHLATRVENRRHQWERAATERAERKAAIMDFLGSAQRIELVLDSRHLGLSDACGTDEEALHDLWLATKAVERSARTGRRGPPRSTPRRSTRACGAAPRARRCPPSGNGGPRSWRRPAVS